ncbi:autophagy-related protein 11 [Typha angustifolia]|uniref:autophagy-related protein 11 n=1 Tax=Typha angustifolia TaxID=59011 RepID=UPI003C2B62BF
MSSGSTVTTNDDFVLGRKLLVHVAENGHSFEFECDGSTTVEAIQRSIESLCRVHIGDQLLLCRNTSLDSQHPLSYYKLPQDDREVFLYNKAKLHSDSPRPPPEAIDVPEAVVPPPPSQDPHSLDRATDPALKALISYEHQFRYHFQLANAVYDCTRVKFEVCKRLLREQQVQERALETARGNLDHTFRKLHQRYTEFIRCFSQQHRSHNDLLANFERDVERLRILKLHPALQSDGRKCLIDLVKEADLRKWADICFNSHRQFEVKVSQLKSNFGELKRKVENLIVAMNSAGSKDLELSIKDHHKILNDQKSIMQSLSKDVSTAKKLVDDSSNPQVTASLRPHDAVSAVGRIYDVHEKDQLTNLHNCDHAISKLLDRSRGKKNEMNLLVHVSMQKVKSAQFSIKDMMNELHAFQEVMGHQDREFENLKFVSGIGHAYRACLAEVVRRKSSLKLYMGLAGQLAERLATEREAEIRRREGFFRTWSKYIPHDILAIMGLFDSPSQCDVSIAPFDANLLQIDLVDVDRLAPPSLVGLPFKSERSGIPKTFPDTSTSCNSAKSEESSLHTGEKIDLQELFEGCDTADIAGTSRMEVENARLKAELASAIAIICSFGAEIGYDSVDEGQINDTLKSMKEKTAEALHLKDEYASHLQLMLNRKQEQCLSYEKRIQELEQRLSDQYLQGQKLVASKDASDSVLSTFKANDCNLDIYGDAQAQLPYSSNILMDEVSSTSASMEPKLDKIAGQPNKDGEGGDENMTDLSGTLNMQSVDSTRNSMDASMLEPPHDEHQVGCINEEGKMMAPELVVSNNTSDVSKEEDPLNILPCGTNDQLAFDVKSKDSLILDLQNSLAEKSKQLDETESKLRNVMEDVNSLRRELEHSRNLLDESQMNCVHLENCLHEAREEARTNKCAAERRASEYDALRSSALKIHSLFERLRSCVTAPGVSGFAETLRSLAVSLASSIKKDEGDGSVEFQQCIKILADKVGFLSRQNVELLDRSSRMESAHAHLIRELEEKKELIKNLYTKHQLEKQASKEKISFGRFEVHELAAFVENSAGHYEAINRNCSNYYLSEESVALFTEHHPSRPDYIIGQIVHIERRTVRALLSLRADQIEASSSDSSGRRSGYGAASNPYNLPAGCEYFVVTVAMLPDTIHSNPS